jgi:hypothetical protein
LARSSSIISSNFPKDSSDLLSMNSFLGKGKKQIFQYLLR